MIWVDILAGWGQDLYPLGLIGPIIMGGARLLRWCCKQSHNCRSIGYSRTVRIVLKRNLTGIELWTLLHSLQLLVNFKFRAIIENFGHLLAHFKGKFGQILSSVANFGHLLALLGKDNIFWIRPRTNCLKKFHPSSLNNLSNQDHSYFAQFVQRKNHILQIVIEYF